MYCSSQRLFAFLALLFSLTSPAFAEVVAEPPSFDGWDLWGEVLIGETRTGVITLRNTGPDYAELTDVVLTYSAPPGFSIQTVPMPHGLADGDTTTIDVSYTPTFDSMTMGRVRVDMADQDSFFIDLFGFAMAADTETSCDDGLDNDMNGLTDCADPVCSDLPLCVPDPLSVSPTEFSFPDVIAGTDDSHTATFIVHNDSDVTVTVTGHSFSNPAGFSLEFEPGFTGELEAGQAYFVFVSFSPETPGEYISDFNIAYSTGGNMGELVIPLDGTGLPAGDIEVTPVVHNFGYQYPGSSWQEVSVRNVTLNPIVLEDIHLTSEAFLISDESTCEDGMTLTGTQECHVLVRFVPASMNAEVGDSFTGKLIITAFDPDGRKTVADLSGSVPGGAWVSSHISTATTDTAFFADGLDMAVINREVYSVYEKTAYLCLYEAGYIRYIKRTTTSNSSWLEPVYPIDYIDPADGEILDCAIAASQDSDYPEVAYLVDDGDYVEIYHRDLFRPASNFVGKVRYEGESDDRVLRHAEIILEKDDLDRTHLAISVEAYPKPGSIDIAVNGQITRPSPAISWEQSEMAWWGGAPQITNYIGHGYLGPHPFIGTPDTLGMLDADGIILAYPDAADFNLKRARNFHVGTRGYRWDWQDVDSSAIAGFGGTPSATTRLDMTFPQYISIASISGPETDVVFKNGRYQSESDSVGEDTELYLSPLHGGVCRAEEADYSVNFKKFAHATDSWFNEQLVFSDPASDSVRFTEVDNYPVTVRDDDFGLIHNQSSQYSETIGPAGSDLNIESFAFADDYVAYIDTSGQLVFARRFWQPPPSSADPAYAITLSPMRETFSGLSPEDSAYKVFMLRNHARETVYIDTGKVRINTLPGDEEKWVFSGCAAREPGTGFYELEGDAPATLPFCIVLVDTPINPVAYLEVTTEGGTTVRAELIAAETLDSDGDGLPDYLESESGTDPYDADTDDDGEEDGPLHSEDLNANGVVDPGETDPRLPDTDGDGLFDGLERGLVDPQTADTDISAGFFAPDADPASQTDPTRADTDDDGLADGQEDANHNGAFEPDLGESDPNLEDTDGDGAGDAEDLCPNDPDKTEPGDLGCGVPEEDDVTPPLISLEVSPDMLWPANHKMVQITVAVSATDDQDPDPLVMLTAITSNEGDNDSGDGNTTDDIEVDEDGNIFLRAERSGTGEGRVYTLVYSAVDDAGNSASASATVVVPHSQ